MPPRTLRVRLVVGIVILLVVSYAVVGSAIAFAAQRFLASDVDRQLVAAGDRFPASLEHRSDSGQDPDGDSRAQAVGTFGARVVAGRIVQAAVVDDDRDDGLQDTDSDALNPLTLTPEDRQRIVALPHDGSVHGLRLSKLGAYRLRAGAGHNGDILVTGLPLQHVERTVAKIVAAEVLVFVIAVTITGIVGAIWIQITLRPLRNVARAATAIARSPVTDEKTPAAAPHDGSPLFSSRPVFEVDPRTEVGRVGAALNRMLEHIRNALMRQHRSQERLRQFAADASHELRTPVANMRAHAELALRSPSLVDREVRHSLERIDSEATRMGLLVDDLLLLARLDAGRPLDQVNVDLTLLVLNAVADARTAAPDHAWVLDMPEEPVVVPGDEQRLHQVVVNLLANERLHTPSGTEVTVKIYTAQDRALLVIHDNGSGVPAELQPHLFDRFTHGPHASSSGSGLGLAIAHAIATAHGGDLTCRSRPGDTEWSLSLPLHPAGGEPNLAN